MKKLTILFFIAVLAFNLNAGSLVKRIKKYSGKNAKALIQLTKYEDPKTAEYAQFILENASDQDLGVLTAEYLKTNIEYAIRTREFKYSSQMSEKLFKHFVLPHRVSQEPLENWRKRFYDELYPIVQNAETMEEAIVLVNLWCNEQMVFQQTSGRDQGPLTTIRRGKGRCEETMIIYIAAARSVGIPARTASAPYWNFTDSNHAWIEVWTPTGWKYIGEIANRLNDTWFTQATSRATMVTSNVFGNFKDSDTVLQENNVTKLITTKYYSDVVRTELSVVDEKSKPVKNAEITLYAASFGGLFPFLSKKTDKDGKLVLTLGLTGCFVMAVKDDKIGMATLDTVEDDKVKITIAPYEQFEKRYNVYFNYVVKDHEKEADILDDYEYRAKISTLTRENKLQKQMKDIEFLEYFELPGKDKYYGSDEKDYRREYLDKANQLYGATEDYLKVYKALKAEDNSTGTYVLNSLILKWDLKDLIELPDSESIRNIVDIYSINKNKSEYTDSIWVNHVIDPVFSRLSPQNGWQKNLKTMIEDKITDSIDETVGNLSKWVMKSTKLDKDVVYTYFTGTRNPLDILNNKYISETDRLVLLESALTLAGVPLRWKGILEYYNGNDFIPVPIDKETSEEQKSRVLKHFFLTMSVDGESIKPDQYKNFLVASQSEEGIYSYTYFEVKEKDSLTVKCSFYKTPESRIMLQSYVRNKNGDYNFFCKSIEDINDSATIHVDLKIPEIKHPAPERKNETVAQKIKDKLGKLLTENGNIKKNKIIVGFAEETSEPQDRIWNQLLGYAVENKNIQLVVYQAGTENNIHKKIPDGVQVFYGEKLSEELNSYPFVLTFNKDNKLVYETHGYKMSIIEDLKLILKN